MLWVMEATPAPGLIRYVPNALTVLRLCALPVIVYLYSLDEPGSSWTTATVILIAALSDIADGYIARTYHVQSEFGRWVDPIVDRAFFFTIVAMLWYFGTLPWLAVVPLLIRDGLILILAIPTRVYTTKGPEISRWGKASNFILICALQWFIVDIRVLGWAFFAVGATLYIASGLWYGYRVLVYVRASRGGGAPA
jgi:CDP-diacylglycerol--glycerol-3-phosphate 3-phosphatidyltransferase